MTTYDMLDAIRRPDPFEQGHEFWNDPYISRRLLEAHVSPDTDAASYRPAMIAAICERLPELMRVEPGASIIDLGCGPGLYCERLASKGFRMTGIDRSENSIRYAREHADENRTRYLLGSYLEPFGANEFDAAMLVWHDYGVLSPADRRILLKNIRSALKPRGAFALDVPGLPEYRSRMGKVSARWHMLEAGFWRPHPHLVLEDTLLYPELDALCDRYFVVDDCGVISYRVWQTFFSPESISRELEENGFAVETITADLTGKPYWDESPTLAIVSRRS